MKKTLILSIAIIFLSTSIASANYPQQPYQGRASYVMAGTPIKAQLDTTLGTEFSNVGDRFTVTLSQAVYAGSQMIAPPGSKAEGFVTEVTAAGRVGTPASMDLRITNIITPTGQRIPISASVNKNLFKLKADGGKVSNLAKGTVGGAAAGSIAGLLGGVFGGGKFGRSTALGTATGAGVGAAVAAFKKGKDLLIQQGIEIPFVVEASTQAPSMPAPTQVQQYGASDFHPGGYHAPAGYQTQQPQQFQPVQQHGGGFRDPYSAQPSHTPPPAPPTGGYQQQQPYNPYLE